MIKIFNYKLLTLFHKLFKELWFHKPENPPILFFNLYSKAILFIQTKLLLFYYLNILYFQTLERLQGALPFAELKEMHHNQLQFQLPSNDTSLPVVFK